MSIANFLEATKGYGKTKQELADLAKLCGLSTQGKRKAEDREEVFTRDDYSCVVCGFHDPHSRMLQIDHIKPKSKGGSDSLHNLQTLCQFCNNIKGMNTVTVMPPKPVMDKNASFTDYMEYVNVLRELFYVHTLRKRSKGFYLVKHSLLDKARQCDYKQLSEDKAFFENVEDLSGAITITVTRKSVNFGDDLLETLWKLAPQYYKIE